MIFIYYTVTETEIDQSRVGTRQFIRVRPSRNQFTASNNRLAPIVKSMDLKSYQTAYVAQNNTLNITQDGVHDKDMRHWDEFVNSAANNQVLDIDCMSEPTINRKYRGHYAQDSETATEFACRHSTRTLTLETISKSDGVDLVLPSSAMASNYGWYGTVRTNQNSITGSVDKNLIVSDQVISFLWFYINEGDDPLKFYVNGRFHADVSPTSFANVTTSTVGINRIEIPTNSPLFFDGINKISIVQPNDADWRATFFRYVLS